MNYADIKQYDVANGPGIRISLFVSGCNHHWILITANHLLMKQLIQL